MLDFTSDVVAARPDTAINVALDNLNWSNSGLVCGMRQIICRSISKDRSRRGSEIWPIQKLPCAECADVLIVGITGRNAETAEPRFEVSAEQLAQEFNIFIEIVL